MLFYVFMALIILIAIAHGPNPVKLPWEKYTVTASGSGKYFLVLWLSSSYVASVLVSKGIILEP
jgi:hypothetical protein